MLCVFSADSKCYAGSSLPCFFFPSFDLCTSLRARFSVLFLDLFDSVLYMFVSCFFLSFYSILNAFYIILISTMIGYCIIVCRPHFDFIVLTNDHSSVHNHSPSVLFSPLLCLYAKPYEFRMWSISVDLYCVCTMRLNGMALACDLLTATST